MPGHIKKADPNEKDPDPLPYLVVTLEMKRADAQLPYDPKKSFYCPDGKHGFMECVLESLDGDKATVMCGHEVINEGNQIIIKKKFHTSKKLIISRSLHSNFTFLEKGIQSLGDWPSQSKKV